MTTIIYIHGGHTHASDKHYQNYLKTRTIHLENTKYWSENLETTGYRVIRIKMPLKEYAQYEDWKITFERHLEVINDELILIGCSLGGIFLAKYLSENQIENITSVHLVCPPYDDYQGGKRLQGGFLLQDDLQLLEHYQPHFYFSEDDPIVLIEEMKQYQQKVKANYHVYASKNGHFIVPEFPELMENLK